MTQEYKFGDAIPAKDGKRWSDDPKVYALITENERLHADNERLRKVPKWFHCDTHGQGNLNAWGCPECVRELRNENERLREALHDISISQNSMYQEARAKQALGEDQNIWRMCGLNTDDVIKMAEEAGIVMSLTDERVTLNKLNRFLELHLKALRNEGYRQCAKGQRTTQFCGLLDAAVKAEREACAKICDGWTHANGDDCAEAIRARGET